MEESVRESGNNLAALVRNKHELVEIRNVLTKSETFWESNELVEENLGTGISADRLFLMIFNIMDDFRQSCI